MNNRDDFKWFFNEYKHLIESSDWDKLYMAATFNSINLIILTNLLLDYVDKNTIYSSIKKYSTAVDIDIATIQSQCILDTIYNRIGKKDDIQYFYYRTPQEIEEEIFPIIKTKYSKLQSIIPTLFTLSSDTLNNLESNGIIYLSYESTGRRIYFYPDNMDLSIWIQTQIQDSTKKLMDKLHKEGAIEIKLSDVIEKLGDICLFEIEDYINPNLASDLILSVWHKLSYGYIVNESYIGHSYYDLYDSDCKFIFEEQ